MPRQYIHLQPEPEPKQCYWCDEWFTPSYTTPDRQVFCSNRCRLRMHRLVKRIERGEVPP
jgi:hypothetical protein